MTNFHPAPEQHNINLDENDHVQSLVRRIPFVMYNFALC